MALRERRLADALSTLGPIGLGVRRLADDILDGLGEVAHDAA